MLRKFLTSLTWGAAQCINNIYIYIDVLVSYCIDMSVLLGVVLPFNPGLQPGHRLHREKNMTVPIPFQT